MRALRGGRSSSSADGVAGGMARRLPGVVAGLLVATAVRAHPLAPCVLEMRETGGGQVDVGWKTPLLRPRGAELEPVLPARCHAVGARTTREEGGGIWTRWTVDCGTGGLAGEQVGITGPGSLALDALVRVILADGGLVQGVLSPSQPVLTVPPRPRARDVVR